MANKKRLKTIIEDELRDLLSPEIKKTLSTDERLKALGVGIMWAGVDGKLSEAEEGSEFKTVYSNDDD